MKGVNILINVLAGISIHPGCHTNFVFLFKFNLNKKHLQRNTLFPHMYLVMRM